MDSSLEETIPRSLWAPAMKRGKRQELMFAPTVTTWHEHPHACYIGMKHSSLNGLQHRTPNVRKETVQANATCQPLNLLAGLALFQWWTCKTMEVLHGVFSMELYQVKGKTSTDLGISHYPFRKEWGLKRQTCGCSRKDSEGLTSKHWT